MWKQYLDEQIYSGSYTKAIQSVHTILVDGNSAINLGGKEELNANNSILLLLKFETKIKSSFKMEIKACDEN